MKKASSKIIVRNTEREDFDAIQALCRKVYPDSPAWDQTQLESHVSLFPEGQFVAVEPETGGIVGMAASLIIPASEYELGSSWKEYTDSGYFRNHDPVRGSTLYGAEIMVDPDSQGKGVGSKLYTARRQLAAKMNLLRIRAGARLRGFHRYQRILNVGEYVSKVVKGELRDETLSFQLRRGFRVISVAQNYLRHDPESLGFAAVIDWRNPLFKFSEVLADVEQSASA